MGTTSCMNYTQDQRKKAFTLLRWTIHREDDCCPRPSAQILPTDMCFFGGMIRCSRKPWTWTKASSREKRKSSSEDWTLSAYGGTVAFPYLATVSWPTFRATGT